MFSQNCVFTVVKKSSLPTVLKRSHHQQSEQIVVSSAPDIEIYQSDLDLEQQELLQGSRKRKVNMTTARRTYDIEEFVRDDEMDHLDPSILVTIPEGYSARKRVRLAHLTEDEKLLRRKVMNRMAAQQARDRKKQRMDHLEAALSRLETEKKYLACENEELHDKLNQMQEKYNQLLQRFLASRGQQNGVSARDVASRPSSGSAVSSPLQQGRSTVAFLMLAQLLLFTYASQPSLPSKIHSKRSFSKPALRLNPIRRTSGNRCTKWWRYARPRKWRLLTS